jgi:hypothetical protein
VRDLIALALEFPSVFLQLDYDMELVLAAGREDGGPGWRKPGEKAVDARDRLREEREKARRRQEAAYGVERGDTGAGRDA